MHHAANAVFVPVRTRRQAAPILEQAVAIFEEMKRMPYFSAMTHWQNLYDVNFNEGEVINKGFEKAFKTLIYRIVENKDKYKNWLDF